MNQKRLTVVAAAVVGLALTASPKGIRYVYSRPWYGSIYNEVCLPLGSFSVDLAAEPALKPRVPAGASSANRSSGRRF